MSERIKRVNELVKETISKVIENNYCYPNTLITVSQVRVSPDLRSAQVFLSIFPYSNKDNVLRFLSDHKNKIQEDFGESITLKYTPKIEIVFDESYEKNSVIDDLFNKIERDKIDR